MSDLPVIFALKGMTMSLRHVPSSFSDTFGKSAQAILDKLLENPADTSFDLEPLVYKSLKKKLDYAEYGGAPLLGIDGCFIICHGSSKAKAIKNAIRVAKEFTENKVVEHIRENIAQEGVLTHAGE